MGPVFEDKELDKAVQEDLEEEINEGCGACHGCGGFCGLMQRYQVLCILIFACIGAGIGVGLSYWEPEDPTAKTTTILWLGLFGDLFIRALRCFVLPLVLVNVIISVVEMMNVGKANTIGWYVIGLYLFTTIVAAIFGVIGTLIFKNKYGSEVFEESGPAYIQLGCSEPGYLLAQGENGTVSCSADYTPEDENVNFIINDISKTFVTAAKGPTEVSLSDTVYQGIFQKMIPDNIVVALSTNNFVAVIVFSIVFGVALSRIVLKAKGKDSFLFNCLKELDACLALILFWIIFLTPFAVCSLIIAAIGKQSDLLEMFQNIGYHIAASMLGWGFQIIFVYWGMFYVMTRIDIVKYHKYMIPAQTMAFACASSAATIPTSLASVKRTGIVPDTIAGFVIPLGATINMDGGAVYFVTACVWMAHLNGIDVTAADYAMLVTIATLGSIGTAPVPSASLVLIITAYNTVFNTTGVPDGFAYILAIDWFMDRCRTVCNVTGDLVISGIVSVRCPLEEGDVEDVKMVDEAQEGPIQTMTVTKTDSLPLTVSQAGTVMPARPSMPQGRDNDEFIDG